MWAILKALVKIAKNLQEIRDILSIAYHDEIELYKLEQQYQRGFKKDKDLEFTAKEDEDEVLEEELLVNVKQEEFKW